MSPQSDSSKIYLVVLAIALLLSGVNFVRAHSFDNDIDNIQSKLHDVNEELDAFKELEGKLDQVVTMVNGLESVFEKESAGFKFNDGLLFMSPNGETKKFTVKKTYKFPVDAEKLSQSLTNSEYGTKICKDLGISTDGFNANDMAEIKITSGPSKGYDILKFTNKKTKESAYVLIMVEDTSK